MIFIDTGPLFSLSVPGEERHAATVRWFRENARVPRITTQFVFAELVTLLRARGQPFAALEAGRQPLEGRLARIKFASRDDFLSGWELFRRFTDKRWSFTDCISSAMIERLGIRTAFAFDHHFRRFGQVEVIP